MLPVYCLVSSMCHRYRGVYHCEGTNGRQPHNLSTLILLAAPTRSAHGSAGATGSDRHKPLGSATLVLDVVFCRPDQCSLTNSYVDNNSSLISE
jgi:hypothetical protein